MVVLIGELMKQADRYIADGLHPRIIAEVGACCLAGCVECDRVWAAATSLGSSQGRGAGCVLHLQHHNRLLPHPLPACLLPHPAPPRLPAWLPRLSACRGMRLPRRTCWSSWMGSRRQ